MYYSSKRFAWAVSCTQSHPSSGTPRRQKLENRNLELGGGGWDPQEELNPQVGGETKQNGGQETVGPGVPAPPRECEGREMPGPPLDC